MLAACASAERPADSAPQEPAAFAPALFVARDADSTIYLYGTIHLRRPGGDWGGENAKAALASAAQLWTEMPIGPQSEAEVQRLVMARGLSMERPLSDRLSAEEFTRFSELAERYGLQAQAMNAMQPWLAGLTLSMLPVMQADMIKPGR